ncbi:MAG: SDR family oxidoreductase [Streptosporangiales bacterium]|nr:SDR family oxidoreductase [Streptosporangiales bacterium]
MLGAGGGLGSALCAALTEAGAEVVAADAPAAQASDRHLEADLSQRGAAAAVVERAWQTYGPLDVLAHVAGLYPAQPALATTEELFDTVLAVNARSALAATTKLAELCAAAGRAATVVFTSSGAAHRPRPGTVAYSASKAALEAITRGLALELAESNVRVNAVAPGFVDVGSTLNPMPREYVDAVGAAVPMGRVGKAADIVPNLMWLSHPSSSWVTGQVLVVDGGASLGSPSTPSWIAR